MTGLLDAWPSTRVPETGPGAWRLRSAEQAGNQLTSKRGLASNPRLHHTPLG